MAVGADPYFEVPLFSHVIDDLWQGCSPSEFPDELESNDYNMVKAWAYDPVGTNKLSNRIRSGLPVKCHWLNDRFDKILNLYPWGKYVVPEESSMTEFEMYDSATGIPENLDDAVKMVISWLEDGRRVLVHCQAGLNRSSLVVARVLMDKYGMEPDEAIDHIRSNRSPLCLCNDTFRQYLKGLV